MPLRVVAKLFRNGAHRLNSFSLPGISNAFPCFRRPSSPLRIIANRSDSAACLDYAMPPLPESCHLLAAAWLNYAIPPSFHPVLCLRRSPRRDADPSLIDPLLFQCTSGHFLRHSVRGFATAGRLRALPLQRTGLLCHLTARPCCAPAAPHTPALIRSPSFRLHASPMPFSSVPGLASALPFTSMPPLISASQCLALAGLVQASHCLRADAHCSAPRCPCAATLVQAFPLLSLDMPSPFSSCRCSAFAMLVHSMPFRGHAHPVATVPFRCSSGLISAAAKPRLSPAMPSGAGLRLSAAIRIPALP